VCGLKAGDPAAWNELVRLHARRLLAIAERITGNAQDAEEATQEALVAAYRGIESFEGRASVGTWLHHIVRRAAIARLHARKRHREVVMDEASEPEATGRDGQVSYRAELSEVIRTALDQLDEISRAVLVLRDVEELSSREVAQALGLSDAVVRQRLHRARRLLAERLRPELCEGGELVCGGELGLLLDSLDETLPADQAAVVSGHLLSCGTCERMARGYRSLMETLHDASWPVRDEDIARIVAVLPALFAREGSKAPPDPVR
jgi:RNA polymerase sigma-70 factor (ECF subfamily)